VSVILAKSGRFQASPFLRRSLATVELIIAVAILGVLALFVVPRMPGWMQRVRRSEAEHMMSQIREAELAYHTEFPGEYIDVFAGLPWDVGRQSKTFDYSVDEGAGTITATRRTNGVDKYEMNLKTGKVTDLDP